MTEDEKKEEMGNETAGADSAESPTGSPDGADAADTDSSDHGSAEKESGAGDTKAAEDVPASASGSTEENLPAFFTVVSPRPEGAYDDLEKAQEAAAELAAAHPGTEVFILSATKING